MDLRDKTVVVTGASSGIGAATAAELSKAGARLVLTARRADRLEELAATLPGECALLTADIAEPSTPQALLDLALERFGRADALINNAGFMVVGRVGKIDIDAVSRLIAVNYEAVVRATYLFAPVFRDQGGGAIINVSSIGAHMMTPKMSVYSGLKRAIEIFTDTLRVELAGTGVKMGCITPGSVATEVFDGIWPESWKEGAIEASDVADAVRYMLEQPDRSNVANLMLYSSQEKF
ncbi:MAG: SDR family oxidoreductase [Sphingomonadales bacterium]|nr:SDR family oxidoreductase [Sphingomonadales bacterium]MBU3991009.1 SDR family oxidoreductase [Alphaproteobacteria bacterium]